MKVLLLASGKSYHATRWANAISDMGYSVTFVTIHKVVRPLNKQVKVFYLGGLGKLSYVTALPGLKRLIQQETPDIVHSHSAGGYGFLGLMSGFSPWILSVYGKDIYIGPEKSPLHKFIIDRMLLKADRVLSTSHAMAEETIRHYPSLKRPEVTPFGVDTVLFKPSIRVGKSSSDCIHFGIVKKLEKKYGIDILITAFSDLLRRPNIDATLDIVGTGQEQDSLQKLSKTLGCSERVRFRGAIPNDEVPRFLNTLDIFVASSREDSESFGVAIVEASAMALPVVVSDVGGLPEVVEHNRTGLVVPREDPIALCNAMERLASDKDLGMRLGLAGRSKVEKEYEWDKNVSQVIDIYEEVLKSGV